MIIKIERNSDIMSHARSIAFILITIVLISFIISSCEGEDADHTHSFGAATCTSPATCECGATEGEPLAHAYVEGLCECGAIDPDYLSGHIHSYSIVIYDATCTESGVAIYTCECGNTYEKILGATGHIYDAVVTEPTCSAPGYTTYTCKCGDTYAANPTEPTDHTYERIVTEPTCMATGYTMYLCECGNSFIADEVATVSHVDTDLDLICDFEGCNEIVIPAADSTLSLAAINQLSTMSANANYYVKGTVTEIIDAKFGIFAISDEEGNTLLIRYPKDADGTSYSAWSTGKVTLGDTVQIYGKPSVNTEGPATYAAKIGAGILTVLTHEHSFTAADCLRSAICGCGVVSSPALGHVDETFDNVCDRCGWDVTLTSEYIGIATNTNGTLDTENKKWTWVGDAFHIEIANGESPAEFYTTSKDFMVLNSQNTFTVCNTTGAVIKEVVIYTTNLTQLANLANAMAKQDLTLTVDEATLCVTVALGSAADFSFVNTSITAAYISGVDVVYVPAVAAE